MVFRSQLIYYTSLVQITVEEDLRRVEDRKDMDAQHAKGLEEACAWLRKAALTSSHRSLN